MTPETFVKQVKKVVIDENNEIYRESFNSADDIDKVTDEYWKEALALFNKLNQNDREVLLKIMRQVSIDSVACIFGIIDGISTFDDKRTEFSLTTISGEKLSGDLADLILDDDL